MEQIKRQPLPPPKTPLTAVMRSMTSEQLLEFASHAGISKDYLYQIAGLHRKKISVQQAFRIEDASTRMARKYRGLPSITAREISQMADLHGVDEG